MRVRTVLGLHSLTFVLDDEQTLLHYLLGPLCESQYSLQVVDNECRNRQWSGRLVTDSTIVVSFVAKDERTSVQLLLIQCVF